MNQERNIRFYMFLRLLMVFSVLVSTVLYTRANALPEETVIRMYFITFFTFLVTTAFIFTYEKVRNVTYFPASQILYDILFTTAIVHYATSHESIYKIFYLFNIIFAALLFGGTGALLAALVSAAGYSGILLWHAIPFTDERYFSFLTTVTSFVAIALLAGQFVEEIRKNKVRINLLEQLKEEIVDRLDSGLIAIDGNGMIQRVNATARELLGKAKFNFSEKRFESCFPELNHILQSEVREIVVGGVRRRILVSKVDLPENNAMILLRDLTDVLDLEEKLRRQERLAGVGRLAAGIAHEIRNPIASISGAAQLLSDKSSDDFVERERLAKIIVRESERVNRLVSELLRFAKPTLVQRANIDFSELVKQTVDSFRARADVQRSLVEIDLVIEDGLTVLGCRDELIEVISNLLVNALQAFGDKGAGQQPILKVVAKHVGSYVELLIIDNGPGIPKEFRSRVFDPFFTTKPTGTGLGLAQVHKIVRDHDGHVDIDSEEGMGTSLKIRLPG